MKVNKKIVIPVIILLVIVAVVVIFYMRTRDNGDKTKGIHAIILCAVSTD